MWQGANVNTDHYRLDLLNPKNDQTTKKDANVWEPHGGEVRGFLTQEGNLYTKRANKTRLAGEVKNLVTVQMKRKLRGSEALGLRKHCSTGSDDASNSLGWPVEHCESGNEEISCKTVKLCTGHQWERGSH